jgi:hypothetical protein
MRTTRFAAGLAVTTVAGLLAAGPAAAAPKVDKADARAEGNQAVVSGTAAFTPVLGPQSVVGASAGLGLQDARITPLADGSGLRFQLLVSSLPEQTPPEGVRYTWGFAVGESAYQLSAKRSNVTNINTTEDPVGTAEHAAKQAGFFELRGACTTTYKGAPLNGCYRLAFLSGSFDVANKTVNIDVPFETRDSIGRLVAPDLKPGATVVDSGVGSAGGTIQASFQAVLSVAQGSNTISGVDPYHVGPQVFLAVGRATANPASAAYTTRATLAPDGTFTGRVPGLTADARTVFVKACNGTECAYGTAPVS